MVIDPVTLGILGAGAVSGVAGAVMSESARKKAERQREAITARIKQMIEEGWETPKYDMEPLSYEEFKNLEQYDPEIAAFVAEKAPKFVREGEAQQAIRAERQALQKLQNLSTTGETAIGRAQRERGLSEADARANAIRQRALDELAKTGQLTGGARILSDVAAAGQGQEIARQSALQASAQEEARRQQALGQVGSLASQMRQEEMSKERTNVDISNRFNERMSMRRQAHLDKIANTRNQAQMENQRREAARQQRNTELRNTMRRIERERADSMEQERARMANEKLRMQTAAEAGTPVSSADPWGRAASTVGEKLFEYGLKRPEAAEPTERVTAENFSKDKYSRTV